MALFKDTEKRKKDKVKQIQNIASLKKVINYVSREDKVGVIDEIISGNNSQLKTIDEASIIKEMLERKDDMLFKYITQGKKTEEKLVTGINCRPSSAFDEMMITKKMFNKTDGRQFKHFVHSYSKFEKNLTPEKAHEITLKLLEHEKFKGFQILVTTHVDTDTLHSHIAVNSVNMETGLKWKHSTGDMRKIRELSNRLCEKYKLEYSFTDTKNNNFKNKEDYYLEEKLKKEKRSWKYETWIVLKECKKISISKEDFINNMKALGYQVRWVDERKDIQLRFNVANGSTRKINLDKFHPKEHYTKEALLKQFEKNKEYESNKQNFENKVRRENLQELYFKTIQFLFEHPEQGDKNYPMTYLEGQALKEKMIEEAKGRGLDFKDEQER